MKKSLLFVVLAMLLSAFSTAFAADMTRRDVDGGCAVIKPERPLKSVWQVLLPESMHCTASIFRQRENFTSELEPLEGFNWELLAEDSVGSAESAVAIANKWITDPTFVAVAGNVLTGESAAVIPIMENLSSRCFLLQQPAPI